MTERHQELELVGPPTEDRGLELAKCNNRKTGAKGEVSLEGHQHAGAMHGNPQKVGHSQQGLERHCLNQGGEGTSQDDALNQMRCQMMQEETSSQEMHRSTQKPPGPPDIGTGPSLPGQERHQPRALTP